MKNVGIRVAIDTNFVSESIILASGFNNKTVCSLELLMFSYLILPKLSMSGDFILELNIGNN